MQADGPDGERRSTGGIVIPATAEVGRRLVWAEVVAVGPNVRTFVVGDRVLYEPEDRGGEVELRGRAYVLLRERDVHALPRRASPRIQPACTCSALLPLPRCAHRGGITIGCTRSADVRRDDLGDAAARCYALRRTRHALVSAPLAQLAEQLTLNQRVRGSSPGGARSSVFLAQSFVPPTMNSSV